MRKSNLTKKVYTYNKEKSKNSLEFLKLCDMIYVFKLEVYRVKTKALDKAPARKVSSIRKIQRKDNWQLFSLTVPGLIVLALFSYLPMFGIVLAFKDYVASDGIFGSEWVGFENFTVFFTGSGKWNEFKMLLTNTVGLNVLYLAVNTIITIIMGMLLFELKNRLAIRVYQTIVFLPFIISWVGAAYAMKANLDVKYGIVNGLLENWGLSPISWYTQPQHWTWLLMLCYLWKKVGHGTIVYYGNLMSVDSSLFEAATLDGANRFQVMANISWPHIRPIVISFTILSLGGVFNSDFGMFYYMTDFNPVRLRARTDVIDTYIIRALQTDPSSIGASTAMGLMQSIAGFLVLMLVNKIASWIDEKGTVF